MDDKEHIIICDESVSKGKYYSNFYGGIIIGSSQYERVNALLNDKKRELNLFNEVKWERVTSAYLEKYQELIKVFFSVIRAGDVRVRIMFRQNANQAVGLSQEQIEGTYFRLYYQFIKHSFGLQHAPPHEVGRKLRLYFDEFPTTGEAVAQFKGFIQALERNPEIKAAGFNIKSEDITEIRSHEHVLAQCLDIVLGSMSFRLNDKHLEKPADSKRRGKRTIAKEKLYRTINKEIQTLRPGFNIGASTGIKELAERWSSPYQHWSFAPKQMSRKLELTKKFNKKSPIQPT